MKAFCSYRLYKPDIPYAFRTEKISKSNTRKNGKICIKCAHNSMCTSSTAIMQSLNKKE